MSAATDESEDHGLLEKAADRLKDLVNKVVRDGVGPLTGSRAYAEARLAQVQGDRYVADMDGVREYRPADKADIERVIDRLIKESVAAAGVSGFVTGLGGLPMLPLTVPANLAGVLIINARLAGAIAYLRGWDVEDPHTQTVVMVVALGTNFQQALRTMGITVSTKVAMQAVKQIPLAVIREINKKVGFMLLAKYGSQRAAITIIKGVPLIGGVVGGTVDATMTALVGRVAKKMFERTA